ncbi:MAG TPA: DinB family protein [Gemmatimonadales bacterium]|nr:DinB family protein [Gemmatimonadales bacterium]
MLTSYILQIMMRDLRTLEREVRAYPDDASLWEAGDGLPNSGGTLAIHLAGNLRHFVGAVLGRSGYVRDRDEEFGARGLTREQVVERLEAAIADLEAAGERVTDDMLEQPYPIALRDMTFATGDFLLHLIAHSGYHIGQVDYHRRALTSSKEGIGAMPIPEMASAKQAG